MAESKAPTISASKKLDAKTQQVASKSSRQQAGVKTVEVAAGTVQAAAPGKSLQPPAKVPSDAASAALLGSKQISPMADVKTAQLQAQSEQDDEDEDGDEDEEGVTTDAKTDSMAMVSQF